MKVSSRLLVAIVSCAPALILLPSSLLASAASASPNEDEPHLLGGSRVLRGRHSSSSSSSSSALQDAPPESSCNRASSLDECQERIDDATSQPCQWCVAGAIPSECMSGEQASLLPAGVFECSTPGGLSRQEFAWEAEDPRTKEKRTITVSVRAGEVRKATTVAGEGGEPRDAEFCDSSSKSLSGYMDLKGSDYDKNGEDKHLFFWMFEKRPSAAESDLPSGGGGGSDASTPFVVWLTGGPGCSSTLALLTENGPCAVNEDGRTTSVNPYSWTEAAHVLWLDQPAGVGFSYGDADDSDEQMVAEDAYWFLQAFFKSYPEYRANPLFIIGESYAGHYVPAISHRIFRGNQDAKEGTQPLPLSGFAIGNGLTNPEQQYPWYPEMVWNNSHHIQVVSEDVYEAMKSVVPHCTGLISKCNDGDGMVNTFACQSAFVLCNMGLTSPYQATGLNPYDIRIPCDVPPLCYDMSYVSRWLNSESTKKALHVDEKRSHAWESCNFGINMQFHTDWMKDFSPFVADLLENGVPGLIYAGDVDFVCNYLGNQAWTYGLEWTGKAGFQAAPVQDWNAGKGLSRSSGGLTFLQVFDAGHMVPKDQPQVALDMLKQFVNHEPF